MQALRPRNEIPTVAQAVDQFIRKNQARKGTVEHISTLRGASRVVGKHAAGPALAKSQLGPLRFDRVSGDDFAVWFHQRHPMTQAASTRKKGRSSLRQLLVFAIASGWTDARVLASLPPVSKSPPRREWLRPEQVAALHALAMDAVGTGELNNAQFFMWRILLDTGVRSEELVTLRPASLNPMDRTLHVIGKGAGDGKSRTIPVNDEFIADWAAYVSRAGIPPSAWLFPQTAFRFQPGEHLQSTRVEVDSSHHCSQKAARTAVAKVYEVANDAVRAGDLAPELFPQFNVTPKVLRRTYACLNIVASSMLGAGRGLDLRSLQQAMGHESLETTAHYLSDVAHYLNRFQRPINVVSAAEEVTRMAAEQRTLPAAA